MSEKKSSGGNSGVSQPFRVMAVRHHVVTQTVADAAYGDGATCQVFAAAGWELVVKVSKRPRIAHYSKADFTLDLVCRACTCPVHKGIFWAGIGGGRRIGGPAPRVARPGAVDKGISTNMLVIN